MFNVYEFFNESEKPIGYRKLTWKELLFIYYECPQKVKLDDMYAQNNCIVYVVSGRKVLHRDGNQWLLTEGKLLFIKKGAYMLERFEDAEWCAIAFYLPDYYLKMISDEYKQHVTNESLQVNDERVFALDANAGTRSFYQSIMSYLNQEPPPQPEIIELKFRELLLTILGNEKNAVLLSHIRGLRADKHQSVKQVMESNCIYNLSLSDYAKIAGLSLASFKRTFGEVYSVPPGKWLLQKRIDHARFLLMNTTKNVNEVSFESGFESSTHFIRVFKGVYGVPPLQYKKQSQVVG